jgi:hypothetical protein
MMFSFPSVRIGYKPDPLALVRYRSPMRKLQLVIGNRHHRHLLNTTVRRRVESFSSFSHSSSSLVAAAAVAHCYRRHRLPKSRRRNGVRNTPGRWAPGRLGIGRRQNANGVRGRIPAMKKQQPQVKILYKEESAVTTRACIHSC